MNIVHICLAASYIEGWGYQENILPQIHARNRYNTVTVLTSDYSFNSKYEKERKTLTNYTNKYGVRVKVLTRSNRYGFYSRFRDFDNVYEELNELKPDIIFVHGGQFVALKDVIRYCKQQKMTKLFIDQHADYYNAPVKNLKSRIVQKIIYGYWMRRAVKYTEKFWGVTPWRCRYLNDVYGIPKEKIGLLVMGADDEKIHFDQMPYLRERIRKELNICADDFVIVAGGKIDRTKNFHLLAEAVIGLNNDKIKLILFGQPDEEMAPAIAQLSKHPNIRNIGWIESDKVYDYFLASDLAVFPGTHSVLWEQACGCGIPCVFKHWEGMHHVDVGGNCRFLYEDSSEEIKSVIKSIYEDKSGYQKMKTAAVERGIKEFSYKNIAKKAIETTDEIAEQ